MQKLINNYRAVPTDANKAKIQSYLRKHPMAVCMLIPTEFQFLKTIGINL
jgi:hypothetical protein